MNAKYVIIIVIALSLSILQSPEVLAFHGHKRITPYGDYCKHVSHYGMHKSIIDMKHAEKALKQYYGKKGLDIEIVSKQGRFLKVIIKDGRDVVDTVIFDRHSGRIRSVH